jgi:PAS domain S-box-containing protein
MFRAIAVAQTGGGLQAIYGHPQDPPPLPVGAAKHLESGHSVLAARDTSVIFVGRAVDALDPRRGMVWAELEPDVLWGAPEVQSALPPDAELCAFEDSRMPLYCPSRIPTATLGQLARRTTSSAGEVEWILHRDAYLGGYWSLFLSSRYLAPPWTFVVSESRASTLAAMSDFKRTFPLVILLTVWVVLLLGFMQIRKTTEPLLRLQEGTRRVAERDFTTPVRITSGDEFEDLATSFNAMAAGLQHQFKESEQLTAALQRASGSLQDNETRLRTILETAADGVITVDERGLITSFNRTAEQTFGYLRDEVIGQPVTLLLPGASPGDVVAAFRLAGGGQEVLGRRQDGTTFPMELAVSEARLGERTVLTGFARDITARKQIEQERAQLEAQLLQSQKLETIGTLAGGIAHDFNNILTAVMGYLELALEETPSESPAYEDLTQVRTAALRAKQLVRQILVFSRRGDQERLPVELDLLVEEALKLLRASLPATIEIRHSLDTGTPPVLADATQIHQVVMNLCTNASHAMRDTGGVLDIGLEVVEVGLKKSGVAPNLPAGQYVRLRVRDTGHGMDRATVDRIFEPFFTTKPVGEGTGLGLSVVHGIVTSHGGGITVQSEPGRGTTFAIYLPVAAAEAAREVAIEPGVVTGTEHVLVVDDDEAIARVTERALKRFGYRVTTRMSSGAALEVFRANPAEFDLVVTDYTMPGMTGVQLARELRLLRPDVPMILATGLGEAITAEEQKALGFRQYLTKPLSLRDFAAAVRQVLDHAKVHG